MSKFSVILAATENGLIGNSSTKSGFPWRLPRDMAYFKEVTSTTGNPEKKNAVVMGRKTWDSIPAKFKPLEGRINVVLTRNPEELRKSGKIPDDVLLYSDLQQAVDALGAMETCETIFIGGGSSIYNEAFASPNCEKVYLTTVLSPAQGDIFVDMKLFNRFASVATEQKYSEVEKDGDFEIQMFVYTRDDKVTDYE